MDQVCGFQKGCSRASSLGKLGGPSFAALFLPAHCFLEQVVVGPRGPLQGAANAEYTPSQTCTDCSTSTACSHSSRVTISAPPWTSPRASVSVMNLQLTFWTEPTIRSNTKEGGTYGKWKGKTRGRAERLRLAAQGFSVGEGCFTVPGRGMAAKGRR